jgi:unsaturated rhamnogalacturonyl hydrolase
MFIMRLPPKPPTLAGNRLSRRVSQCGLGLQVVIAIYIGVAIPSCAQSATWSERVANTILQLNPVNETGARPANAWGEETGLQLEGLDAVWYNTANGDYFRYGKGRVDEFLRANVPTDSDNRTTGALDDALLGRQLLLLYRVTLDTKYHEAAAGIRRQVVADCNISSSARSGSRSESPCMAQPFLAEYASVFQEPTDFAGITRSFEKWNRSAQTLSRELDQAAVYSDTLPARLAVALVDSLPSYPQEDPGRGELIAMLNRIATEAVQHQDTETGLFDELPRSTTSNHHPASPTAECLLIYALAKGARLGYLPERDSLHAQRTWQGVLKHFVQQDPGGVIRMTQGAVHNARNRSAAEDKGSAPPAALKDPNKEGIGLGALLLAAAEVDNAPTAAIARGERVMLDAWFNSQQRKNAAGQSESFHYKWSDLSDSGYSLFGNIFQSFGAMTETLYSAPTQGNLAKAQFYIIVSPDIPSKNPNPNYMTDHDAEGIAAWVKGGGVLVLMENDPPNADIAHLNLLADRFGIHFDDVLHHHIIGEQVEDGRIPVAAEGKLFHHPHTLYMKDTCSISLSGPAVALLRDRGDVVMATAKYGRGTIFAAVDPWLYNEYTDGRKKPQIYNQFDNFAGGKELVQWLLQQRPR